MQPIRRPIGLPMEMMDDVVEYQINEEQVPLPSPEEQVARAQIFIEQRQERLAQVAAVVRAQLEENGEVFAELEEILQAMAQENPFMAAENQIPELEQALNDQKNMYREAVEALENTRCQLQQTRANNEILSKKVQSLKSIVKLPPRGPHSGFLNDCSKKMGSYAADPSHHRYDKYKTPSRYERFKNERK